MKSVLFLPSWYPSRLDAFTVDFIQRHAKALSFFTPVHVVFIVRDKKKSITNSIKIEENRIGNLSETIIYYACKDYGFRFIDKLIAMRKYIPYTSNIFCNCSQIFLDQCMYMYRIKPA